MSQVMGDQSLNEELIALQSQGSALKRVKREE